MRKSKLLIGYVSFAMILSGCLKTRSQLREDSDERDGKPIPVQPMTDVQPQGQHYAIDELKEEFTQLVGRIEDLERGQKEILSKVNSGDKEESNKKLANRISQLEEEQTALQTSASTLQTSLQEVIKKLHESPPVPVDPNELFKKAKTRYDAGDFEAAVEAFGTYLKSPKGKHAEEATFLRGESYFKLKQYKKAIVEYSKFPEKLTHSKFMPEALLKIGWSFDALGMKDDAKGFYQELIEKYPKSAEAKKAKKKVK